MKKIRHFPLLALLLAGLVLSACSAGDTEPDVAAERGASAPTVLQAQSNDSRRGADAQEVEVTRVVTQVVEVEGESLAAEAVAADGAAMAQSLSRVQGTPAAVAESAGAPPQSSAYQQPALTPEPVTDMRFEDVGVNPFVDAAVDPLSTFAIDVDTGAYSIMRRYLTDSLLPPSNSVRVEEYINYFDQAYAPPADDAFAIYLDGAPAPYAEDDNHRLVRVGIQGYEVSEAERPDALLIFVVDVSGSMNRDDRLGLVKQSLRTLVENLRPTDRIALVVYGSTARVILEPTLAVADRTILNAIDQLQPEGSTNAEAGLRVAYELAGRFAEPGQINRLILCSDGVANVGNTTAETILEHAHEGIALSTFGFGLDNYNDVLMEQLADQGDGSYAYIDTLDEAERVFATQLTSTILTIARDVKIQVEFNPDVVARYRLLGYENRDVADADFRNDAVDAGEIGAGHSVTALYEIELAPDAPQAAAALTVRVRYAAAKANEVNEIARAIALRDFAARFEDAAAHFRMTVVVAEFAEMLRNSFWAREGNFDALAADARLVAAEIGHADVVEFSALVAQAAALSR